MNFKENSWDFGDQLVEIFEISRWNFGKITKKKFKKFKRNWAKNFKWIQKNYGNLEVIRNWCRRYYEEILENFSKIISVKLGKNYEEMLEKLRKNMGNTSHQLKKTILMETLWKFLGNFWKHLQKIEQKILNSRGKSKKFWKYLGRSWKSAQGRFKLNPAMGMWTINIIIL